MADASGAADVNANKVSLVAHLRLFAGAVEPAEKDIGVGTGGHEMHFAARFELVVQPEWANPVGIVGIIAAAPQAAADFAGRTARDAGFGAIAEVMSADLFQVFKRGAV